VHDERATIQKALGGAPLVPRIRETCLLYISEYSAERRHVRKWSR